MRSAGNFHPEWGYLAPAPSFMRTARIALVATAIGATAGAVVVVSLLDRPGSADDNTSIAAHALVTGAPLIVSPAATASPLAKSPAAKSAAAEPAAVITPAPLTPPAAVAAAPTPASANRPEAAALAPPNKQGFAPVPAAAPAPASVAALDQTEPSAPGSAAAPAPLHPDTAIAPEDEPAKKFVSKTRRPYDAGRRWRSADDAKKRWRDNRGFGPLFRLFSSRTGSSTYPN